ncbi:RNA-dependent RNA polymerase [Grosmannia clavigera partitivirus 1]|nr:RNA-dependent RNA polymerase [Grosmannia clavigera partitivirus 1]
MLNLKVIGKYPALGKPIHGHGDTESSIRKVTADIIDHALRKFLSPEEADQVINGYRRSEWNENALNKDLEKLNSREHIVIKDEHYWNAINHVKSLLTPEKPLQPVHFADLRHYKWNLSTSIGAPFATSEKWTSYVKAKYNFAKRGIPFESRAHRDLFTEAHQTSEPLEIRDARMTKHNLYSEAFTITRKNIHLIKEGRTHNEKGHDLRYWNTAFARRHLVSNDEEDKVRLVFGAPFTLLCAELMFIWPLQVFLLTMTGPHAFMLWGFETILGGWYRLRNFFARYAPHAEAVVTIDWSGFDRYARHSVIRDVHSQIIRPMFDFTHGYHPTKHYQHHEETPGEKPYSERLENLWNWMTDSVLSIPLMLPDGTLCRFQHSGIFSGYFQTQILDSLYNLVMLFTILSRMGFDLKKVVIKVQGDDSIFKLFCCFILIVNSFMTLFKHYAQIYFGAVVNDKKSDIRNTLEHAEVLKYRNAGGIPSRDRIPLLAQLRHPERSSAPENVAARAVGIAYAACGQDPLVYMICEDIYTFLTTKMEVTPRQRELDTMFKYIDSSFEDLPHTFSAAKFPTFNETLQHLMDGPKPLSRAHWPEIFNGLPGRN